LQSLFAFVKITFASGGKSECFRFSGVATRIRRSSPFFRLVSSVFLFPAIVAARNVGRVDRRNLNRRFYLLVKNNPRNAELLRVRNVKKRSREENVDALKRRASFNDATLIFRSF
jgi:hypothetical protein